MKKRVVAYARVSTNSKSQEHSFEFQSYYWNTTLGNNPEYEYIGLFADKGISGKFVSRRPQFMAMMDACRNGKVDIVFCKSVQRFARNTLELLTAVRELRELHIAVIFEKENINTLNSDSELYLTIAAAIAEDDLTRYGKNIEWTIQDKFKRGENVMGYNLYGYHVINKSKLEINPEEAKVVKEIFELYASGKYSTVKIAKMLNDKGIQSPGGTKWQYTQILSMLKNEKYKGDLLLQKTYTEKGNRKRNRGQKPMYYVEENHEPIISKELWDKTQKMREEKSNKKNIGRKQEIYPFTSLIECGVCGCGYVHKVNNSGTEYATPYWNCSNSIKNGVKTCNTTGIKDKILKEKFIEAYNEFVTNKYVGLEEQPIRENLNKLYEKERELMQLKVNGWITDDNYNQEKASIDSTIKTEQEKLTSLTSFNIDERDFQTIDEFDENKLHKFIKKVIISRWIVTFEFYNGVQITKTYTNGTHGMIQDWRKKQWQK